MKLIKSVLLAVVLTFVLAACDDSHTGHDDVTVSDVIEAIDNLPVASAVTKEDGADIDEARELFESLSSEDQALVTNLEKLVAVEAAYALLPGTIVDEAIENGFDTLVAAVLEAELADALSSDTELTVFAPTDGAFSKLLLELNTDASGLLAHPFLTEILLYHVVEGRVLASTVVSLIEAGSGTATVETLLGASLTLTLVENKVTINGVSTVLLTDVLASNGVIHVIDTVLIPEDIVSIAVNAGFSILATAVTQEELVETLSNQGPFTVFAPTNQAFTNLIALLETDAEGLLAREDLTDILLYHVVNGKVLAEAVLGLIESGSGSATVPTLLTGKVITVTFDGNHVILNGSIKVTTTDIVALNGVIHVIDGVLIPPVEVVTITVTFLGFNNVSLGTQTIESGASLTFPTPPSIAGYTFSGWNNDGSLVTENTTINANYEKIMFNATTLAQYNGKNGANAYIAYKGVVYNVTGNPNWPNGVHRGVFNAGQDLTQAFQTAGASHGESNITGLPVVGFFE